MTLGTVQLGKDYGINNTTGKPDIQAAHEILSLALKNGINSLDTASAYGDSEAVIGSFIKQSNETPFIITKFFTASPPESNEADIQKLEKDLVVSIPVSIVGVNGNLYYSQADNIRFQNEKATSIIENIVHKSLTMDLSKEKKEYEKYHGK